ncbi:hypothetical protein D7X48_18300 [bacterium D16-50]|nr:hypothetical protein D7X48_18300 [bacterium D16-50]
MGDIIRVGRISTIDYASGTASVVYTDRCGEVSPQFPFFSVCYEMPKVDEMAVVVMLPNSTTKGFIVGVPYSDRKLPHKSGRGIFFKEFSDGASILYDPQNKVLHIDADNIVMNNVKVEGRLTADCIEASKAEIGELAAGEIIVSQSADLESLKVRGTAEVANLIVKGTAIGHWSE